MAAVAVVAPDAGEKRLLLAGKEKESFRTLVDCYEKKQFSKGLKFADLILKKHSNHGETQAMKGLIMNSLGRKEEAYELVKLGLKNDVRSHICWHVFGLLHRSDVNYKEAIKCYQNALKIDPGNQNILRDLSWLQVQMRDMPGFLETRQIVMKHTKSRQSWIALSVAHYLNGGFESAFNTIRDYRKTLTAADKADKYEESELILYQNKCLEKRNEKEFFEEAIAHLTDNKTSIRDKLSFHIKLAQLYVLSGRFLEGKLKWMALAQDQPDNYRFHCGLQVAYLELDPELSSSMFDLKRLDLPSTVLSLTSEQLAILREMYEKAALKSKVVRTIELTLYPVSNKDCSEDDSPKFETLLDKHMRECLSKGIPALYHDIFALIKIPDPENSGRSIFPSESVDFASHPVTKVAFALVEGYVSCLNSVGAFDEKEATKKEPPPSLLWTLYLKCCLEDKSGRINDALVTIDACIEHTSTALDMYCKKAKLLRKVGAYSAAADVMDECRSLDLQDRYLNNKTTKYFLRADRMEEAMATIAMFTKHEGDPQKILYDLQCNWYELEAAECYARSKQWGQALKKYNAVKKHFDDYYDDLFDFHGYCVRKSTVRAYLDVLAMQDDSYTHKFFQRATRGAVTVLLHLVDKPEDIDGLGHLVPAERKKVREKIKKQKKKESDLLAQAKEDERLFGKDAMKDDSAAPAVSDDDPIGDKLLAKGDFINEAKTWCSVLAERLKLVDPDTLAFMAEVRFRTNEYPELLEILRVGLQREPHHPELACVLVKVAMKSIVTAKKGAAVPAAVKTDLHTLLTGSEDASATITITTITAFIDSFIEVTAPLCSLQHSLAGCRLLMAVLGLTASPIDLSSAVAERIVALVKQITPPEGTLHWGSTFRGMSVNAANEASKYLGEILGSEAPVVVSFRAAVNIAFPSGTSSASTRGEIES